MAKEKAAAERPPHGETRTFTLTRPLKDAEGNEVRELTLVEPELRHAVQAERAHPTSPSKQTIHLIAALGGVTEGVIERLVVKDAREIQRWLARLDTAAALRDHFEEGALEQTFELSVPIPTDKAPITRVTVRAPDLGASVAVERFKLDGEVKAALIAYLADLTIPVVMRMKRRDVARIEGWLGPFVDDVNSEKDSSPGETSLSVSAT